MDDSENREAIVQQLFDHGIAHHQQWTLISKDVPTSDRESILQELRAKFASNVALIHQLPKPDEDPIKEAFFNIEENWFYQIFDAAGYSPSVVAKTFNLWLNGHLNTIVLFGDVLSSAKSVFNAIASCFPMSVIDSRLNNIESMEQISSDASLYCVPFITSKPNPLMMHIIEGNDLTCNVKARITHIKAMPCLMHVTDISLAQDFIARNTVLFFLGDHYTKFNQCHMPRFELRDFVNHAASYSCIMNVHCKKKNPICTSCMLNDDQ